ncbi:MAG TPA: efflux RND transporter permease subunit [Variovorax sp.]
MKASAWLHAHRRSLLFAFALLALAGVVTGLGLPISLFPNVSFPRVVVALDAGDRPAEQMATLVTLPVEQAVRRVPGLVDMQSTSSRGSAELSINFDWGIDMAQATLQVNAAIAQVLPSLPAGTQMEVRRMDPTVFPIIAYSITSDQQSPSALYDLAQYKLPPLLSSTPGVARVQVSGGAREEFRVVIDPARLATYKLSLADVGKALAANNVVSAAGRVEDHYKLYLVVVNSPLASLEDVGRTVIASGSNGIVHLRDIAAVERSTEPQWTRVTADGRDAVLLNIYQQPGSSSVGIARAIRQQLADYQPQLPPGVHLTNWYDASVLVTDSAASVRDAILVGVLLAAATLFAFLRSWKITLVAVGMLPIVLASAVLLLGLFNMGFNIMTLGGMAAAVGLVVDDAIVMVEHIVRRLDQAVLRAGEPFPERVLRSALEFTRPLAGSSAATLVIFIPLTFLSGVTGAFFKALSLTMASALLISFILTLVAVPLLCASWLTRKDVAHEAEGRFFAAVRRCYAGASRWLIARPWMALLVVLPFVALCGFAYTRVGTGFMPAMDEGGFVLDYRAPPGTALSETDRLLRQVEAIIQADPAVQTYSRRTGLGLGGGLNEANQGDFFIRLKAPAQREPIDQVMEDLRGRIESQVPGLNIEMAQLMEDLIGDLTAVPQPVQIKIHSEDPQVLQGAATRVAAAISKIDGLEGVRDGINPAGDALELHVDPEAAAVEGVDADFIARGLTELLSGSVAGQTLQGTKTVGIRLWVPPALRASDTAIGQALLRAPDGHLFPIGRVARLVAVTGQPQIERDNMKRVVAVTARIGGRDLGSAIADVQKVMQDPGLLKGQATYELGGLYEQQQIAFKGLMAVFAAAVALVFALLLFLYESFRVAAAIILMPLLAAGSTLVGLWLTGIELNISSMMGMTMVIGIVTEVAIFYVSELGVVRAQGDATQEDLFLQAGLNRLRPIAMTTIAAILALLPLALGIGQGSAMQQPLAVAIISGLIVQMPLVLLVLPALLKATQGRAEPYPNAHTITA